MDLSKLDMIEKLERLLRLSNSEDEKCPVSNTRKLEVALRNLAPELLAVVAAARYWRESQKHNGFYADPYHGFVKTGHALNALEAKLKEVCGD